MNGVLPMWVVLPPSALLLLLLAAWVTVAARHVQPSSRRRIRCASAWVMLLIVPLSAAGFCMIDPDRSPREFVLVWTMVIGLLMVVVALAGLDIVNTARLRNISRRRMSVQGRVLEHQLRTAVERAVRGVDDETSA